MKNGLIVETMMISRTERKPAFSIRTGFSVSTTAGRSESFDQSVITCPLDQTIVHQVEFLGAERFVLAEAPVRVSVDARH
jgi:hypothetical protein